MYPLYSKEENDFELYRRKARHIGPHLHASLELVLVLEGSVELGIGYDLFHMNTGDLALVFPNQIHHYQAFEARSRVEYLLAAPTLAGSFLTLIQNKLPENPVVPAKQIHADVLYALQTLTGRRKKNEFDDILHASYVQIILARTLPFLVLTDKGSGESGLVDKIVTYISTHYMEEVTLTSMARDLFMNPFALSRVFSEVFHMNFNRYLNLTRLEYSRNMLEETDKTVTEICLEAGFGSQRSFNRVFQEEQHMTPLQYRRFSRGGEM